MGTIKSIIGFIEGRISCNEHNYNRTYENSLAIRELEGVLEFIEGMY